MEKEKNNDVQLGIHVQGYIALKESRYQFLPLGTGNEELEILDEIMKADVSTKGFTLIYSRKIRFVPSANFEISVVFESQVSFDNDAGVKILKEDSKVMEWISNNEERIANTFCLPAKASQIISCLTQSAGYNPLVTPPQILPSKPSENS